MTVPQLPTDNLYKFIALFGLLLVMFFLTVPTYFSHQIQIKSIEANAEVLASDYRRADLFSMSRTKADHDEIRRKGFEENVTGQMAIADGRKEIADFLKAQAVRLQYAAKVGTFFAVIISALGFILWYVKLQRWQDLAQMQAAKDCSVPHATPSDKEQTAPAKNHSQSSKPRSK